MPTILNRVRRPRTRQTQPAEGAAPLAAGERDGVTYGETVTLGPELEKATKAAKAETKA